MFEFKKGNIDIYGSQNGVLNINRLERKCFICKFMIIFRSKHVIILSRVIVMDNTSFEKFFTYHLRKKAFVEFEHV